MSINHSGDWKPKYTASKTYTATQWMKKKSQLATYAVFTITFPEWITVLPFSKKVFPLVL